LKVVSQVVCGWLLSIFGEYQSIFVTDEELRLNGI
jgi:hypothetical protein